jgi:hypothetical protein
MYGKTSMEPFQSPESLRSYFIEQIKDYAIFATDAKGFINAWNIGAERIKGYIEEQVLK